jgi:NO-binding membrane sensor protein with MHYT domain
MHFVGNRAIVLGDGEEEIQLYYNATYTTVSAILPIVVIFMGFLVADRFYRGSRGSTTRYAALLICGVLSGAAVTEMHYLGNQGTTNYHLRQGWQFIVGAASIAVVACCISFGLFFHWSGHWINNIWRRFIIACVLALAVSGMHWTAAGGTSYELRGYHAGPGQARNVNLIIAVCMVCWRVFRIPFAFGFHILIFDSASVPAVFALLLASSNNAINGS